MRTMFKLFAFLYIFAPIFVVPYWAYRFGTWYLLFGILFSFAGSFSAAKESKAIYLFACICVGYWIRSGFDFHQYTTFYFFCSLWGYVIWRIAESYDQESKRGTLDNDEEMLSHLSDNREQIEAKLLKFIKENPGKELTYEEIDKIVRDKD